MQIPRLVVLHLSAFEAARVATFLESSVFGVRSHVNGPAEVNYVQLGYLFVRSIAVKITFLEMLLL